MVQTVSFGFEALFLLGALLSTVGLVAAVVLLIRRRFTAGNRLLLTLAISWAAYLSIVFLVAAMARPQIVPLNHDLCFDEMCFAVANVATTRRIGSATASGIFYVVTVRVSNHARGRAQSELGLCALLWSGDRRIEPSSIAQREGVESHPDSLPLTARIQPGQSILSEQVFDVPTQATGLGLFFSHGFTPGYFVIGECPLFHRPTMLRVAP